MEKRDLAILLLAIGVVVVMAVIVKPVLTGKSVDFSVPHMPGLSPEPEPTGTIPGQDIVQATPRMTTVRTPAPTPTWSGKSSTIGYVAVGTPDTGSNFTRFPETAPVSEKMLTYASISSVGGGTTQTISMPFPYWELHYTVDPWETTFVGETESKEAGPAGHTASEVFPSFSIEVRDAGDNSLVREIQPQGGLNKKFWEEEEENDPRPWIEKFYEGRTRRSYYFVVHTHMINSYSMDVKVPERYLGKY